MELRSVPRSRCSTLAAHYLMDVIAAVLSIEPDDLARSIRKSLRDLVRFKGKLPENIRSRFDIRVHPVLPFGSAILLDHKQPNGRIQIETKPYKVGLQKSFAFEVMRKDQDGLYDVLASSYHALLADGQPVGTEEI